MLPAQRRSAFVPLAAVVAASCGLNLLDPAAALAARQVKLTINGNISANTPSTQGIFPVGAQVSWEYIIQEYSPRTTSGSQYTWSQSTIQSNPLFGPGTLSNSTGVTGTYNFAGAPLTTDYLQIDSVAETFEFLTGRAITNLNVGTSDVYLSFVSGNLPGLDVDTNAQNIYDFLVRDPSQPVVYACSSSNPATSTCNGEGNIDIGEGTITMLWSQISIDNLSTVPGPFPAAGLIGLITWSRKLKRRSRSSL